MTEKLKMISNVQRPAWTSESSTGMFNAFKHRHRRSEIELHHYGRTLGFNTRREAADLVEN